MTWFSWEHKILLWTLVSSMATSTATVLDTSEEHPIDFGLAAWVDSLKGGYFNPKQEIRRENPDDPTSILGVFAKEQIFEGELLNRVPWHAIIDGEDEDEDEDDDNEDEDEEDPTVPCRTARKLAKEMKLGKDSRFAPYVQYLLNQPQGQLPSAWSPQGKALLATLLGGTPSHPHIRPIDVASWLDETWIDECQGDMKDAFAAHAFMLVVQRADDDIMVPVYDLYNHRNGKYYNTKNKIKPGKSHELRASRTIEPGEQLHNSYNLCAECPGRYVGYGTAELFRDYGFVERFPQRWYFSDPKLQFDLHEELNSEGAVEYQLRWHRLLHPMRYSQRSIEELTQKLLEEILRVDQVQKTAMMNVPEKEWNLIWEYKNAVKRAYSMAINEMVLKEEDRVPVESRTNCEGSENCATFRQ